jgi:hypothetical protein
MNDTIYDETTPDCFKVLNFFKQTRHNNFADHTYEYQDLKGRLFTASEKRWLFQEVYKDNGIRIWENQIFFKKKALLNRYNIYQSFFKKNEKSFDENKLSNNGSGIDGISLIYIEEISKQVMIARHNSAPIKDSALRVLINDGYQKTAIDRGKVDPFFEGVCNRTYIKIIEKHGFLLRSDYCIQQAQVDACKCPYMSYHWYLICLALGNHLPAAYKTNIDATTYVFTPVGKGEKSVKMINENDFEIDIEDKIKLKSEIKSTLTGSALPFAIKEMRQINAAGDSSEFCFIVAIKELSPDDWYVEEVVGLSMSSSVSTVGYIYFSKTRCGTVGMWKDYFKRVCIPFIKKVLEANQHKKDTMGNSFRTNLSSDGEDIILRNAFDPEIRELFRSLDIDYTRVGAGTTRIHNACDRAGTFKHVHRKNKETIRKNTDISNPDLEEKLEITFKNLKLKFPSISIGSGHIKNIISGLLRLTYVYQVVHNRVQAIQAFRVSGQHCAPHPVTGSTVDFEKMMYQCYSTISKSQMDLMYNLAPMFVRDYVLKVGHVPHEILGQYGIQTGATTINRDDLCGMRHSSEIITHDETLNRYKEFHRIRDPLFIAENKKIKDAFDIIEKERLRKEKEEGIIAMKLIEKDRLAALTSQEKKAEDDLKKINAALKRTAKADKRKIESDTIAEKLKIARLLVNDENNPNAYTAANILIDVNQAADDYISGDEFNELLNGS